jgi:DNA helicase II / ATP-dependent DNA helicase PcrA
LKQQFTNDLNFKTQLAQLETGNFDNSKLKTQDSKLPHTEGVVLPDNFLENAFIADRLKEFQLTISALNAYLDCPLSFYFEHLLNIPAEPSAAFHYGSAVHFALRRLFAEMLRDRQKAFPTVGDFVQFFETDLTRRQVFFEADDFAYRLTSGKAKLTQFYTQFIDIFSRNVLVERTIVAQIEGIPARGVLDKIEFKTDNVAHIVDYKTGKPNDADTRRPTARNPMGGAYWRQLVFYKMLYENYRANLVRVTTGEICHLETDAQGKFTVKTLDLTQKDADILRGGILEVWQKIQARQFDGCGKKTCKWCNFIRNNYTPNSFRNEAREDLDD